MIVPEIIIALLYRICNIYFEHTFAFIAHPLSRSLLSWSFVTPISGLCVWDMYFRIVLGFIFFIGTHSSYTPNISRVITTVATAPAPMAVSAPGKV